MKYIFIILVVIMLMWLSFATGFNYGYAKGEQNYVLSEFESIFSP